MLVKSYPKNKILIKDRRSSLRYRIYREVVTCDRNLILDLQYQNLITMKSTTFLLAICVFLFSCVSSKKFKKSQADYATLQTQYTGLQGNLNDCNTQKADMTKKNGDLASQLDAANKQIALLKENNTQALKQLEDLSVISSSQAESIKKSMENI